MDPSDSARKPNRAIAVVLSALTGWGTGHFYVGMPRRALAWLGAGTSLYLILSAAFPTIGAKAGFGVALALSIAALVALWVTSIFDLLSLDAARFRVTTTGRIMAFAVVALAVGFVTRAIARATCLEAFKIPAGSMMPTLFPGDHFFADKLVYSSRPPARGEVIVFDSPESPGTDFVKRVIGVPGDRVEFLRGRTVVNGWELPNCYLGKATIASDIARSSAVTGEVYVEYLQGHAYLTFFEDGRSAPASRATPFVVPEREFFVVGDNRWNSHDSRSWFGGRGGTVPRKSVRGRATSVWLSFSSAGIERGRTGISVDLPRLPRGFLHLDVPFKKCLASTPPLEKTTPPPPSPASVLSR
ncbi:MAG: signal peptidase I [Polyangiaceae bacterium]